MPLFLLASLVHAAPGQAIAIVHGAIIDGRGGAPIRDGTILIRGRKIDSVGAALKVPADARVIDVQGKTVIPGLADMHVHLDGGWDGVTVDLLGYRRYLNSLLYAGVTTVLDTGNVQPFILQLRQEIAAGRLPGPRIYCAGALIDGPDPSTPATSFAVSSEDQIPRIVERQKSNGVDIIKAYAGLSESMVRRLAEEAGKAGLRVFIDQGPRNGSVELMQTGISAFAHLPTGPMSAAALALAKSKQISFMTTLAAYESFSGLRLAHLDFLKLPLVADTMPPWFIEELRTMVGRPSRPQDESQRSAWAGRLRAAQENVRRLSAAGVLVAAGTDASYPGDWFGEGLHRELELLVEAGLAPLQVLTMATRNAARLMNAEKEWGTLEPGMLANVVVVNGHPDRNISDTRRIELVVKEGTILDRQQLRFDRTKDPGFRTAASSAVNPQ
jgi:imidazolonepropionase-like amidohydrolase